MSEVVEVAPARCPVCGADWAAPKTMRPGWDNGITTGDYGGRTWECLSCGDLTFARRVELRPTGR